MRTPLAGALGMFAAVAGSVLAPGSAQAFGHLWEITEIYWNADGSVQFVELFSEHPGETGVTGTFLRSDANNRNFDFPSDLTGSTLARQLLVATAAFAAQPGAVTPDYVMPDGFVRTSGDTIGFWTDGSYFFPPALWDSLTFGGATPLPVDGILSLERDHTSGAIAEALNSPTNFAGDVGSLAVPEPGSAELVAFGLAALALGARGAVARTRGAQHSA